MTNILSLFDVTKRFRRNDPPAVDRLNLTVRSGEILALVGQSGSGKTTTLRIIAGFEQPDSGRVELDGTVVAHPNAHTPVENRGIGMVFQEHALFPHLTVWSNVAFGLSHLNEEEQVGRVQELLELTGLTGFEKRFPHELSGGQLQRVGLARALAPQPKLILLDEPFNNLDNSLRSRLVREMREILKRTGTAALFVTHHRDETFAMADRVAFMRKGALEQVGPPRDVYLRPSSRSVAEFFGPVNVIPAAYMRSKVMTAFGSLPAGSPRSDNGAPNCACELLVRPHEIRLEAARNEIENALAIPGTVVERTFHGEYQELRVQPNPPHADRFGGASAGTDSANGAPRQQPAGGPNAQSEASTRPSLLTVRVDGNCTYAVGDTVSLTIEAHVISCCACRPELEGHSLRNGTHPVGTLSRLAGFAHRLSHRLSDRFSRGRDRRLSAGKSEPS